MHGPRWEGPEAPSVNQEVVLRTSHLLARVSHLKTTEALVPNTRVRGAALTPYFLLRRAGFELACCLGADLRSLGWASVCSCPTIRLTVLASESLFLR